MWQDGGTVDVALKELLIKDQLDAIYDFQHEITIMRYMIKSRRKKYLYFTSKLTHENVVKLYGITKSPLQMVLEFVPCSDLFQVLESNILPIKWKLKVAIDCASGMK